MCMIKPSEVYIKIDLSYLDEVQLVLLVHLHQTRPSQNVFAEPVTDTCHKKNARNSFILMPSSSPNITNSDTRTNQSDAPHVHRSLAVVHPLQRQSSSDQNGNDCCRCKISIRNLSWDWQVAGKVQSQQRTI